VEPLSFYSVDCSSFEAKRQLMAVGQVQKFRLRCRTGSCSAGAAVGAK